MTDTKNHGSLGSNLKVHFAGAEVFEFSRILNSVGINYFLFTIFPFICKDFGIPWQTLSTVKNFVPIVELPKFSKHVIMDSGLFSLMFGAHKAVKPDEKFIRKWKDAIAEYVIANDINHRITVVECDCQKLLGTNLAWNLREELRSQLPNNKIINVFHFEDGNEGLKSMIDFSDYIAISVPEIRIVKPKTYKQDVYRLAYYIKDRKPEIDIHLLGCTQESILRKTSFCTSSDSTSWLQINKFGTFAKRPKSSIKQAVVDNYEKKVKEIMCELGIELKPTRVNYLAHYAFAGEILKKQYESWVGNQD